MKNLAALILTISVWLGVYSIQAQVFTRITDPANPIVTDFDSTNYYGCSWIDVDGDGDLDLFVNNSYLYQNDGNGKFTKIIGSGLGEGLPNSLGNGNSWADYDNDGDMDVFIAGDLGSYLYRNDGGQFTKITGHGLSGTDDNGFAAAWGDYDNDGFVDLIIASPFGFGPTHSNLLYHNKGDGSFERVDTSAVSKDLAAFTVPSWFDYDQDGDIDLFIGTGPITATGGPDYFFKNMLKETGTAFFSRITSGNFATDLRDGQNVNWVDYDNDRDLDMYVTNYGQNGTSIRPNNLYRNDGNGVFTKITDSPITTDSDVSLGNLWADFDNDGDLDCFVTNEFVTGQTNRYYRNDGNGVFTRISNIPPVIGTGGFNGATAGDYDNDGDLDLFVFGFPAGFRRFYRNDQPTGNQWLRMRLSGTISNRASIGARVKAKATISGIPVWQYREISAQNTFNGHNALDIHFGFGDAASIDSVIIIWPSGIVKYLTDVQSNQILNVTENADSGIRPDFIAAENDTAYQDVIFQKTIHAYAHPVPVYHTIQAPEGLSIDSTGGLISWIPADGQTGNHTIMVEASNGFGTDTLTFSITVQNSIIPQAAPISERSLFAGWPWKDTIMVNANPQAAFAILSGPSGITIGSQTGIVSWTPGANQVGETQVRIRISNIVGADTLNISISVFSPPSISVLQNPVLSHYANIVVNSSTLLAQSPILSVSGSIAAPANPQALLISGTDRSYRSEIRFIQSGVLNITAAVTSQTGAKASPGRTYQVVLAKQGTIASVVSPDGKAKIRTTVSEVSDTYWIAGSWTSGEETAYEFGPARASQKTLIVSFKDDDHIGGGKIYERVGDSWIEVQGAAIKNGWLEASTFHTGTFKAVFQKTGSSAIPYEIRLHANYPNPFNPTTIISYDINKSTEVHIAIYNIFGQKVKTLIHGNQPAGRHQIVWDATNDNGTQVASGLYYYRLEASGFNETKKMLLIK